MKDVIRLSKKDQELLEEAISIFNRYDNDWAEVCDFDNDTQMLLNTVLHFGIRKIKETYHILESE